VVLSSSFWLGLTYFPELGVLSVCYAWVLICPLLLAAHVVVMRRLIALPAGEYLKTVLAGVGPMPLIVIGLLLLDRVTFFELPKVLHLLLLAGVALLLHWAYLRWVLKVRFRELLPKRRVPAS
jgi:hypothetical protein